MKVKSFSFLEILVSIVISAMVISTVYSVYVFTYKQFIKFTTIKTETKNYFELASVLNREMENAKKIIKINDYELQFLLIDKTINYAFNEQHILRTINPHQVDTFFMKVSHFQATTVNENAQQPLVNHLVITMEDKGREKVLSLYKTYGAILEVEE